VLNRAAYSLSSWGLKIFCIGLRSQSRDEILHLLDQSLQLK
jgi:hypothetical protein